MPPNLHVALTRAWQWFLFGAVLAAVPAGVVWLFRPDFELWDAMVLRGDLVLFAAPLAAGAVPQLIQCKNLGGRLRSFMHAVWVSFFVLSLLFLGLVSGRVAKLTPEISMTASYGLFIASILVALAIVVSTALVDP